MGRQSQDRRAQSAHVDDRELQRQLRIFGVVGHAQPGPPLLEQRTQAQGVESHLGYLRAHDGGARHAALGELQGLRGARDLQGRDLSAEIEPQLTAGVGLKVHVRLRGRNLDA